MKNLVALEVLDLQYNDIDFLQIMPGQFMRLSTLKLNFNKVPPAHIAELGKLPSLTHLELGSNELSTLPANMSFLVNLKELNLSGNNFSSDSILVSAPDLIRSVGLLPNLEVLNLSRNKFNSFHQEALNPDEKFFPNLIELNMAFNTIEDQHGLEYCLYMAQT